MIVNLQYTILFLLSDIFVINIIFLCGIDNLIKWASAAEGEDQLYVQAVCLAMPTMPFLDNQLLILALQNKKKDIQIWGKAGLFPISQ